MDPLNFGDVSLDVVQLGTKSEQFSVRLFRTAAG